MRVVFHHRRPLAGRYFSIEGSFEAMRRELPAGIRWEVATAPQQSRGLRGTLRNMLAARGRDADVHHVTGDTYYVALALPSAATVLTIHDLGYRTRTSGPRQRAIEWLWYRAPCARARVVTTVSEFTRAELLRHAGVPPEKVVVVPTCISPLYGRVDRPFHEERPTVLHVGTAANKNLERLAAALSGIPCHLRVIGPLSAAQERLLRSARLSWSSATELADRELVAEYARADVVAFVSTYEGFGMPIVEGNTVGRPVVTSSVASMPEVAGRAACLVDPFDVDAIRAGLLRVMRDRGYRRRLVEAGFENAARFAPAEVARRYSELYLAVTAPFGKRCARPV